MPHVPQLPAPPPPALLPAPAPPSRGGVRIGPARISMRQFSVSPDAVVRFLIGRDLQTDPLSGVSDVHKR